jgi:hypothetical protein
VQPDPEARSGTLESLRLCSRALRPPRGSPGLPAGALPAGPAAIRCWSSTTAHDYLRYAALRTVLDNLIHRAGGGAARRRAHPVAAAAARVRRRRAPRALRRRGAGAETRRALSAGARPARPWPDGRELRRGGGARGRVARPGFFGRLLLQSGSFAFTDIGPSPRGPAFQPVVEFVNAYRERPERVAERVFLSCGVYESLIYENRSSCPCCNAPAWRCDSSKRGTGTTGRTGATACARVSPGSSRARSG